MKNNIVAYSSAQLDFVKAYRVEDMHLKIYAGYTESVQYITGTMLDYISLVTCNFTGTVSLQEHKRLGTHITKVKMIPTRMPKSINLFKIT